MKILLISTLFSPSIGGIETVSEILADEFTKAGHEVKVITDTPSGNNNKSAKYCIIRQPGLVRLFKEIKWCDVSLHSCISIKYLWAFFIFRRPVFAVHHTWYRVENGIKRLRDKLKLFLTRYINNICVSKAVQKEIPAASIVITNPYDEEIFKVLPDYIRNIDLVYLGRLVSDKGVDTLLHALAILKNKNITPRLNIIGDGPECGNLKKLSESLTLKEQVGFLGNKSGQELVNLLNQHKIMVIPSKWEEPYGIVALEGLACGLKIIASAGGGLPEAAEGFGEYFTRGDSMDLAEKIEKVLYNSKNNLNELDIPGLSVHLSKHYKKVVAETYLSSFKQIIC